MLPSCTTRAGHLLLGSTFTPSRLCHKLNTQSRFLHTPRREDLFSGQGEAGAMARAKILEEEHALQIERAIERDKRLERNFKIFTGGLLIAVFATALGLSVKKSDKRKKALVVNSEADL